MEHFTCEICGSNNIIKQDGFFVCQQCGCKYSSEEISKAINVLKTNSVNEISDLLTLARRAHKEGNSENAEIYYRKIMQLTPDNWEAVFFQVYFRAMQSKIGEMRYYAELVGNNLETTSALLEKCNKPEQIEAINIITSSCIKLSELFSSVAVDHFNKFITVKGSFEECVSTLVQVNLIIAKLEVITKYFSDDKNMIINLQKYYISYLNSYKKFFNNDYLNTTITRLSNEIGQIDTSYIAPTSNSGGCYVATAVYGSYDCPEVWTLRRFRDNILAKTWCGRAFIHIYYTISPTLVKWFGATQWFKNICRLPLDNFVNKLNSNGIKNTPYNDKKW